MPLKLQKTENANSKTVSTQSSNINIWAYDVTLLRLLFKKLYNIAQQQNQFGNRYTPYFEEGLPLSGEAQLYSHATHCCRSY
jgi:hypothetical protein